MSYFDSKSYKKRRHKAEADRVKEEQDKRNDCPYNNPDLHKGNFIYCYCNYLKDQGWENIPVTKSACFKEPETKGVLKLLLANINLEKEKENESTNPL